MFSLIKNVISSVLGFNSSSLDSDKELEEKTILDNINAINSETEVSLGDVTTEENLIGESQFVLSEVERFKCVHKTGKITHLCGDYGLIDGVICFEQSQVVPGLVLHLHDEVRYKAFRARENETDRVYKIYALKNDPWDEGVTTNPESQIDSGGAVEEITAFTRTVTGMVTKKGGKGLYIDSLNIWCDLETIESSFIPIEGDWISLEVTIVVNKDVADLTGDILEVKSLTPLLKKEGIGRITQWAVLKREGVIENYIHFESVNCKDGYIPNLGDEVTYEAIESDQNGFKWRATNVIPNEDCEKNNINIDNNEQYFDCAFFDKNGISIRPAVCAIELELHQTKNVVFEIINNAEVNHCLKYSKFLTKMNSQIALINPKETDNVIIKPNQRKEFHFECRGKNLGLSGEIFLFYFQNFLIARKIEVNVTGNREMNKLLNCKFGTLVRYFSEKSYPVEANKEAAAVFCGKKPWKLPNFIAKESRCIFNIPKKLWTIKNSAMNEAKLYNTLEEYAPYLVESLTYESYSDKFHTLLYLEEIFVRKSIRQFDMNGVYFVRNDNFLVLTVPGLVEKRPSVIVGDVIEVTEQWMEERVVKHIGYIYKICEKEIFVKFHSSFHENYNETECNVVFQPNVNFFSKCHEAINRVMKTHTKQWLFPDSDAEKLPLVDLFIQQEVDCEIKPVVSLPKNAKINKPLKSAVDSQNNMKNVDSTKKSVTNDTLNTKEKGFRRPLTWAHQCLNDRQKLAVTSVLKAQCRPLPYIIFGPPGTGKTVTLVEIIIHISRIFPSSRILVVTPSNSSADLICERLIELENLKPGKLVRLVALYRVADGSIPEKLLPYATFLHVGTNLSDLNVPEGLQSSSLKELAGKHRITIATCVTIGTLHYFGFTKGHFSHIIVDEAGQTCEPEILIPLTFQDIRHGQVILCGDPQQLGPVICSREGRKYGLNLSLLQRLISTFPYAKDLDKFPNTSGFNPKFITQLNVNYRSVPEILALPSQMFYGASLTPTVSQTDGPEADIINNFNFKIENREKPPALIFHGIVGQNYQERDSPSWYNPHEIWQAVLYLRRLYSIGLTCDKIGIVSPYSKQVKKLRNLITSLDLPLPKVGSVEEFQGQERFVIILTTVRSSPKLVQKDVMHSLGFVAAPQRLNVGLTRARALLIIIGNPLLLARDPYWNVVLKYCLLNNSYVGCSLEHEEYQKMKEELAKNAETDDNGVDGDDNKQDEDQDDR